MAIVLYYNYWSRLSYSGSSKKYGVVNARVVSMGRYGKTREIMGALHDRVVKRLMQQ